MMAKWHETRRPVFSFYVPKAVYLIVSIMNFVKGMKLKMYINKR
jgi:hypothetical protein